MRDEDSSLIQIKLPNRSLLILTREEFEKACRRGESVLRNRALKNKPKDTESNILEGIRVYEE